MLSALAATTSYQNFQCQEYHPIACVSKHQTATTEPICDGLLVSTCISLLVIAALRIVCDGYVVTRTVTISAVMH